MTTIANALSELGVTEWVLRGEPTTEAEFNEMFRKVTGSDANGTAIESSDPDDWGTTWAAVSAKKMNWSMLNLCACYAKNVTAASPKQIGGRDQITQ